LLVAARAKGKKDLEQTIKRYIESLKKARTKRFKSV
jgi:hypothetical protein